MQNPPEKEQGEKEAKEQGAFFHYKHGTITPANNNGPIEKYGRSCERRNVDGARLQPVLPQWMKFHACRSGS